MFCVSHTSNFYMHFQQETGTMDMTNKQWGMVQIAMESQWNNGLWVWGAWIICAAWRSGDKHRSNEGTVNNEPWCKHIVEVIQYILRIRDPCMPIVSIVWQPTTRQMNRLPQCFTKYIRNSCSSSEKWGEVYVQSELTRKDKVGIWEKDPPHPNCVIPLPMAIMRWRIICWHI